MIILGTFRGVIGTVFLDDFQDITGVLDNLFAYI